MRLAVAKNNLLSLSQYLKYDALLAWHVYWMHLEYILLFFDCPMNFDGKTDHSAIAVKSILKDLYMLTTV